MSTADLEQQSTRDLLVSVALRLLDSSDQSDFTLRRLAKEAGVSHTVVYKHFRSKDDLLAQAFVRLYTHEVLMLSRPGENPRQRLESMCTALRRSYVRHPRLVSAMVMASGEYTQSKEFQLQVLACMREMGVNEALLPICYQALESFVIGGAYFDFNAFPSHVSERRSAYGAIPDLMLGPLTDEEIRGHTQRAFELGLSALLDGMSDLEEVRTSASA